MQAPPKTGALNIRAIKDWAARNLPDDSVLRSVIVSEPDELTMEAYFAKMDIWLKLVKREASRSPFH